MARLESIYRYPVKGLSPEKLTAVRLEAGQTLPADRKYAIENGPSGFDPAAPSYLPKTRFLMLMRNERLATLDTRYDDATHVLTIHGEGREIARGDLSTSEGRLAIEAFFRRFMPKELTGPPKVLQRRRSQFLRRLRQGGVDHQSGVGRGDRNAGGRSGAPAALPRQPLCRRLAGLERVRSGRTGVRDRRRAPEGHQADHALRGDQRRSADTGIRDLQIPATLTRNLDHADCGIYAKVITPGEIAPGADVLILDKPEAPLGIR